MQLIYHIVNKRGQTINEHPLFLVKLTRQLVVEENYNFLFYHFLFNF